MTLATRSSNQICQRKKSVGSPAATTKKRTKRTSTASSSKKSQGRLQTRTILHYFSPTSQTSSQKGSTPKKSTEQLLPLEPFSPVPLSSLSCHFERLSQDDDAMLSCSQESKVVMDKQQVVKSTDEHRKSRQKKDCSQRKSRTCSITSCENGDDNEKRLDCKPDGTKQKTVCNAISTNYDNYEIVAKNEESRNLSGKKRTRSNDTNGLVSDDCHRAPSAGRYKRNLTTCDLTENVHIPTVGDRTLIQCPMQDLFVDAKHSRWVSGSITNVDLRKENELNRDDDDDDYSRCLLTVETIHGETIQSSYPNPNIRDITSNQGSVSFVYDENPFILNAGDLVEVRSQQKEQWQSGRIANVSEDNKFVDIAYFNGKYEIGVPSGLGYIRLVEKGQNGAMNWLVGSTMNDNRTDCKGKASAKSTILEILPCDDAIEGIGGGECLLERSDGTRITMAYDDTLIALFSAHKENCLKRGDLIQWPEKRSMDCSSSAESVTCKTMGKTPKIGDVVRMLFNQRDLFVHENKVWSIGKIVALSEGSDCSFKIQVVWSDKIEEEYKYPNDDLEILTPKGDSNSMVYTSSLSNDNGSIAFDPNPSQLQLGDHVQCFYQNGLSNGQWWPGRVAKLHVKENLVDVAYFDGEYEIGVPLNENKINFIESGIDSATKWLVGADITVASHAKAKGRKGNSKVVMIFKESESVSDTVKSIKDVKVLVQTQRGGLVEKPFVYIYTRMISSLYKEKLQDNKVLLWPTYNSVPQMKNRIKGTEDVCANDIKARNLVEDCNPFDFQELQIEDDSDIDEAVFETNGPRLSEMQSSLGNACWRNLHSSEPQNGYYILHHTLSSWKYMPNENLSHSFSSFLLDGPLNDNIKILEPYRTELTFLYLEQVLETQSVHEYSCRRNSIDCLDFEKLLEFPSDDTNCKLNGTTFSDSDICLIAKQLQFRSMALHFAARCITEELRLVVSAEIEASTETFLKRRFVSCILRRGVRDSLKMFVKTYVRFMSKYGHWLIGTYDVPAYASSTNEQLCAFEVERFLKALGTLISYTAWLLSVREKITLIDYSCCGLMRDTFENEFSTLNFYSDPSKKKLKERRKKDMKLQFLFSLETVFSREFQRELSKMFNVSKEFELLVSA